VASVDQHVDEVGVQRVDECLVERLLVDGAVQQGEAGLAGLVRLTMADVDQERIDDCATGMVGPDPLRQSLCCRLNPGAGRFPDPLEESRIRRGRLGIGDGEELGVDAQAPEDLQPPHPVVVGVLQIRDAGSIAPVVCDDQRPSDRDGPGRRRGDRERVQQGG
jgi:hypothetical protein